MPFRANPKTASSTSSFVVIAVAAAALHAGGVAVAWYMHEPMPAYVATPEVDCEAEARLRAQQDAARCEAAGGQGCDQVAARNLDSYVADCRVTLAAASCVGDAGLRAVGAGLMCLTPFGDDTNCLQGIGALARRDLDACHPTMPESRPVAMYTPKKVEQLAPVPLAELLKPKPKPKPQVALKPKPMIPRPKPKPKLTPPKPKPQPKSKPKPKPKPRRPAKSMQIVETIPPELQIKPDKARLLSAYNTKVKEEMVARGSLEDMVDKPSPRELTPSKEKLPDPKEVRNNPKIQNNNGTGGEKANKPAPPELEKAPRERGRGGKEVAALEGAGRSRGGDPLDEPVERKPKATSKQENAGSPGLAPTLHPSESQLKRTIGGGNVDHLKGVKRGDRTALNSIGYVHAPFFNRIKRAIARNWNPAREHHLRDPKGNVHGFKDRHTVLDVTLNPDGSVAKLLVDKASGVSHLDDEALRALRAAAPFSNPPKALVEKGIINFRFGFYFAIGRPKPTLFRMR